MTAATSSFRTRIGSRLPGGAIWSVQRPDGSWREVLDPWARAVCNANWDRSQPISATNGLRGILTDTRDGF